MKTGTLGLLACVALAVAGCGRMGDSGMNPFRWFGGANQPTTLDPKGGYPTQNQDARQPIFRVTAARWEPLYEGGMLVVTGVAATKGWWDAALITEVPMPSGRIRPDENGVLRLRLVGHPPPQNTFEAAVPATPATDTITVSMTLSHSALSNLRQVVISGGSNSVTLRK